MTTVNQILKNRTSEVWTISPEATIYDAIALMAEKNIGALPVVENEQLVGIFSERDFARRVELKGRSSTDTQIREVMTENVICITSNQKIEECMQIMADKHIRHLPVKENNKLVGMVTIRDVIKIILKQKEATIRELEGYIRNGGYVGFA